jgi:hypothetical protein
MQNVRAETKNETRAKDRHSGLASEGILNGAGKAGKFCAGGSG